MYESYVSRCVFPPPPSFESESSVFVFREREREGVCGCKVEKRRRGRGGVEDDCEHKSQSFGVGQVSSSTSGRIDKAEIIS